MTDQNSQPAELKQSESSETDASVLQVPVSEEGVLTGEEAEATIRNLSRRSFLWAGAAVTGTLGGLWAFNRFAPETNGLKAAFHTTHRFNEAVARTVFFSPMHRAQEFPRERAVTPKNNYHSGTPVVDRDAWRLMLIGPNGDSRLLTLEELRTLPRIEETTELKCVEGWSAVVTWAGARFADFAARFAPGQSARYVAMRSEPEGQEDTWYYVGLDMESCLHPQTLLAYEMNGAPLDAAHGAPLRLVMPHKYGIKNIKLITHIAFLNDRPRDYWADRGYDWYAGL